MSLTKYQKCDRKVMFVMLLLVQYWGGLHLICCAVWGRRKKQADADRQKKRERICPICYVSPLCRISRYFHIDGMTYCNLVNSIHIFALRGRCKNMFHFGGRPNFDYVKETIIELCLLLLFCCSFETFVTVLYIKSNGQTRSGQI